MMRIVASAASAFAANIAKIDATLVIKTTWALETEDAAAQSERKDSTVLCRSSDQAIWLADDCGLDTRLREYPVSRHQWPKPGTLPKLLTPPARKIIANKTRLKRSAQWPGMARRAESSCALPSPHTMPHREKKKVA
ncbi:MAG: hypothetical protein NZ555_00635 [Geminicoccaceae bacterium]|nr:hypothetical protein [Geminicoccaceae bacterium]